MKLAYERLLCGAALLCSGVLASAQSRRLSGTLAGGDVSDGDFALSGDGAHVVFSGHFTPSWEPSRQIYSSPADGSGEAVALFPSNQPLGGGGGVPDVSAFALTPDARRVVLAVDHNGYFGSQLLATSIEGGTQPIVLAGGLESYSWLRVSPDGERVVFAFRDQQFSGREGVYSVRLDSRLRPAELRTPLQLSDAAPDEGEFLDFRISADSRWVVYTWTALDLGCTDCDAVDPVELFVAPIDGGAPPRKLSRTLRRDRLGRPPREAPADGVLGEAVSELVLSDDGTRVAFVMREQHGACSTGCGFVTRLWSAALAGGEPVHLFTGALESPALSADASRVVFLGDLDGDGLGLELLSQPSDGSAAPLRLHPPLAPGGTVTGFALAPDGLDAVFSADLAGRGAVELFRVPLDGSAEPRRVSSPLASGRAVNGFAISADSRHAVYRADPDAAGLFELFRAPLDAVPTHARRAGAPPPDHVVRLTDVGPVAGFELAGGDVLFHASLDDVEQLWRVQLDGSAPAVRVSGPEGGGAFHAAGGRVAFRGSIEHETESHVYAAPLDGSGPALRIDDPPPHALLGSVSQFELHPDGRRAFFLASMREYDLVELFVARVDRAAPIERMAGLVPEGGRLVDFRLVSSADRVTYRVLRPDVDGSSYSLWAAPLDGSAPGVQLAPYVQAPQEYIVAGERVVFRAPEPGGHFELYSVPLDGSAPPVTLSLPFPPHVGLVSEFSVSADCARAVYFANQFQGNRFELFTVPTDGSAPALPLNEPLVTGGDVEHWAISPDSTRVVFTADTFLDNAVELYSVPIDRSAPPLRLHPAQPQPRDVEAIAITPDSTRVVFIADQTVAHRHEVYVVPIDGSAPPTPLDPAPLAGADAAHPYVDPDGAWVVYASNVTFANRTDLLAVPLDGSAPPRVLNPPLIAGGNVRPDLAPPAFAGGWVAYWADQEVDEHYELFSAPLDGSAPALRLSRTQGQWGQVHWVFRAASNERVVFQANEQGEVYDRFELFEVPIDGSAPARRVNDALVPGGTVPRFGSGSSWLVHPDGRSVLYLAMQEVLALELWQGYLDPLLPAQPPR